MPLHAGPRVSQVPVVETVRRVCLMVLLGRGRAAAESREEFAAEGEKTRYGGDTFMIPLA